MQARSSVWLIHFKKKMPQVWKQEPLWRLLLFTSIWTGQGMWEDLVQTHGVPAPPGHGDHRAAWPRPPSHMVCADSVTFSPQNPQRKLSQHSSQGCQTPDDDHKHHRPATQRWKWQQNYSFSTVGLKRPPPFQKQTLHSRGPLKKNAMKPQI